MKKQVNNIKDDVSKILIEARKLKSVAEDLVKKDILESIAPKVREALSNQIAEMDDFEDEELLEADEEIIEDEDGFESEFVEESDGEEESEVDDDTEMSHENDDEESEDNLELPEDSEEEMVEEAEDSDDDIKAFMEELKSLMNESEESEETETEDVEDTEDLEESEDYDEEVEDLEESEKHDDDYDDEEEKIKECTSNKKYESLIRENRKLKRNLERVSNMIKETSLDLKRANAYNKIIAETKLTETQKLRVMKQLDEAKNERDIQRVYESISSLLKRNKPSTKRNIKENRVVGKFSKTIKRNINESKKATIGYDFADMLAHLADIK